MAAGKIDCVIAGLGKQIVLVAKRKGQSNPCGNDKFSPQEIADAAPLGIDCAQRCWHRALCLREHVRI